MIRNTPRFRPALLACSALLGVALLSACSSTPEAAPAPPALSDEQLQRQQVFDGARKFIERGHYLAAETELQRLLKNPTRDTLRRDALAELILLQLNRNNPRGDISLALLSLDQLNAMGQQDRQQEQLFRALSSAVEIQVRLEQAAQRNSQASEIQAQLRREIDSLQRALEQLRRLSLQ